MSGVVFYEPVRVHGGDAARADVALFNTLGGLDGSTFIDRLGQLLGGEYADTVAALPRWTAGKGVDFDELTEFDRCHGAGLFARYRAFLWENGELYPVVEYRVSGEEITVVDMIPGYTHNIINLSDTEDLVTVMWANEPFDPNKPDTFFEPVE